MKIAHVTELIGKIQLNYLLGYYGQEGTGQYHSHKVIDDFKLGYHIMKMYSAL